MLTVYTFRHTKQSREAFLIVHLKISSGTDGGDTWSRYTVTPSVPAEGYSRSDRTVCDMSVYHSLERVGRSWWNAILSVYP